MQTIRYVGPFDSIEFEQAPKTWTVVAHGETVVVADDMAAQLLEQPDNWQAVEAAKPRKPRAKKSDEAAAEPPESDPAPTTEPASVSDDSTPQEG